MRKKILLTDHGRGRPVTLCGTTLSMSDLAKRTGYSLGYVSRTLRGERAAGKDALASFAKHLCVSVKTLTGLIAEERSKPK